MFPLSSEETAWVNLKHINHVKIKYERGNNEVKAEHELTRVLNLFRADESR